MLARDGLWVDEFSLLQWWRKFGRSRSCWSCWSWWRSPCWKGCCSASRAPPRLSVTPRWPPAPTTWTDRSSRPSGTLSEFWLLKEWCTCPGNCFKIRLAMFHNLEIMFLEVSFLLAIDFIIERGKKTKCLNPLDPVSPVDVEMKWNCSELSRTFLCF